MGVLASFLIVTIHLSRSCLSSFPGTLEQVNRSSPTHHEYYLARKPNHREKGKCFAAILKTELFPLESWGVSEDADEVSCGGGSG